MNTTVKYLLGLAALGVAVFFSWYFFSIIVYILVAAVISFIGRPLVYLLGRLRIKGYELPEGMKAGLALACIWFLLIIAFCTVIPLAVQEFQSLEDVKVGNIVEQLHQPITDVETYLKDKGMMNADVDVGRKITEGVDGFLNVTRMRELFGKLAGTVTDLFVALFSITFISFFFLKDSRLFTRMVLAVVPVHYEEQAQNALDTIERLLVRYFVGLVLEVVGVMTLNTLGLSIVGLDFSNALIIGLVAGILNVVPYIGPLIGIVFGLAVGVVLHLDLDFYTQLLPRLFYMGLAMSLTQLVDNVFFQPFIYGNSVHAHPLEIFLVILMAGSIAGVPGMILAIPTYTVFRVILKEFFNKYKLVKQLTKSLNG